MKRFLGLICLFRVLGALLSRCLICLVFEEWIFFGNVAFDLYERN